MYQTQAPSKTSLSCVPGLYGNDYPVVGGTFGENFQKTPGKPFVASNHSAKPNFERPNYLEEDAKAATTAQKIVVKEERPKLKSELVDEAKN